MVRSKWLPVARGSPPWPFAAADCDMLADLDVRGPKALKAAGFEVVGAKC